jgi:AcrR family transcriptional regulator
MHRANREGGGTKRFQAKRDAILAAAADAINEQSAKGMTFADVARRVGLNTTSVTYYFKRKEDLAAAAFEQTLERLDAMLDAALEEPTPEARVARYLNINMERLARIRRGEERDFAILSDLRAMEDPMKGQLLTGWRNIFRKTRSLWGAGASPRRDRSARRPRACAAREHLLAHRLAAALRSRRISARRGAADGRVPLRHRRARGRLGAEMLDLEHDEPEPGREAFLLAATRLINELGYRGASVQRIASELNVTKGSFYHHLDAKDELVIACYKRSFDIIADAQRLAESHDGSHWERLESTIATLLDYQFSERGPLLRTTALSGLPPRVRSR